MTGGVEKVNKGVIHVLGVRFHRTTQSITKFKTDKWFTYGILYLIFFLDHGWPQVTKTVQSETE